MSEPQEAIPPTESNTVEFKSFFGGMSAKELSQTLCAFANTEGGNVYLGVTDTGDRTGLKITPALLDLIQNSAREGCIPGVAIQLSEIPVATGRSVIRIGVEKSARLHTTAAGHAYLRVGTQDKRMLGDELLRLAQTKSQSSFEDELLKVGLEAIDSESLASYYQADARFPPLDPRFSTKSY